MRQAPPESRDEPSDDPPASEHDSVDSVDRSFESNELASDDEGDLGRADAWLRRLAERIVADPHTADDLAQETWVASLESFPRGEPPPRAWLRVVARVKLLETLRRRRRRERREREGARREDVPSSHELASRRSVARALREAVGRLPDPYAKVVRRRFFDERSVAEIARELRKPQQTVKTQLRKALALLREDLDRRARGDRTKWMGALVALAGERPAKRALLGGAFASFVLSWRRVASAALVVATVWVAWVVMRPGAPSVAIASDASTERARALAAGIELGAAAEGTPLDARHDARLVASAPPAESDSPPARPAADRAVNVRLVAPDGSALGDTKVSVWRVGRGTVELASTTTSDGRASIAYAADDLTRGSSEPAPLASELEGRLALVLEGPRYHAADRWLLDVSAPAQHEHVLVLEEQAIAWSRTFVADDTRAPIAGVDVTVISTRPVLERVGEPGSHPAIVWRAPIELRADERGSLTIASLPPGPFQLRASAKGFFEHRGGLGAGLDPGGSGTIAMRRAPVVFGVVRDEHGAPVAGARVRCETTTTDVTLDAISGSDGSYELCLPAELARLDVFAVHPEHADRVDHERVTPRRGERLQWDPFLTASPVVRIELVRPDGTPASRALVLFVRSSEASLGDAYGSRWAPVRVSDAEGRVVLHELPDEPIDALVFPTTQLADLPVANRRGLVPRDEPYRIPLADPSRDLARLEATFRGDGWELDEDPLVLVFLPDLGFHGALQLRDRSLVPAHLPAIPCHLAVRMGALGVAWYGPFDLRAGEAFDAGVLRVPAKARLEWITDGLEGETDIEWHRGVQPTSDGRVPMMTFQAEEGVPPRELASLAGRQTLRIFRGGIEWSRRIVDVAPGATTRVIDSPEPAGALVLRVRFETPRSACWMQIRREPGDTFFLQRREPVTSEGIATFRVVLEPGEYGVTTFDDPSASPRRHSVRVPPEGCAGMTVELEQ